ncbi:hypothetical protein FE784_21125 [Paenibacillus hemerocallicola]|uniref:Uncharacterized protein n=1 Tax=Paenibacillus hemerocallicola TaxID=1172614 RepID=A0A5C4T5J3_9BACL|nr:hypothetical protein FE784_21125 [Paenibacillus hemerocallicola]
MHSYHLLSSHSLALFGQLRSKRGCGLLVGVGYGRQHFRASGTIHRLQYFEHSRLTGRIHLDQNRRRAFRNHLRERLPEIVLRNRRSRFLLLLLVNVQSSLQRGNLQIFRRNDILQLDRGFSRYGRSHLLQYFAAVGRLHFA